MANSKNVLLATDDNFNTEVLANAGLTMVDFWAEWCGPCKALGPTIDALADQFAGQVKVYKMNVDEHPGAAQQFNIRGIPTILFFKDGKIVDQLVGNQPKDSFVSVVQKHL